MYYIFPKKRSLEWTLVVLTFLSSVLPIGVAAEGANRISAQVPLPEECVWEASQPTDVRNRLITLGIPDVVIPPTVNKYTVVPIDIPTGIALFDHQSRGELDSFLWQFLACYNRNYWTTASHLTDHYLANSFPTRSLEAFDEFARRVNPSTQESLPFTGIGATFGWTQFDDGRMGVYALTGLADMRVDPPTLQYPEFFLFIFEPKDGSFLVDQFISLGEAIIPSRSQSD